MPKVDGRETHPLLAPPGPAPGIGENNQKETTHTAMHYPRSRRDTEGLVPSTERIVGLAQARRWSGRQSLRCPCWNADNVTKETTIGVPRIATLTGASKRMVIMPFGSWKKTLDQRQTNPRPCHPIYDMLSTHIEDCNGLHPCNPLHLQWIADITRLGKYPTAVPYATGPRRFTRPR